MKTLIKNGLIYDGSGEKAYEADVLIEHDKIAKIGRNLSADAKVLDVSGNVVTPGFIDTHRHCDLAALLDDTFGTIELRQGLTSVVGGNCGLGIFPATEAYRRQMYDYIEPCLGVAPENLPVSSYQEYMDALEKKGMPLHVGSYIGMGAVKAAVKGYGSGPFTKTEMEQAKACIIEGLEAGALGLSMGIMYQPECYSSETEMTELLQAAAPYGKTVTCHIRGEGDNLIPSVREVVQLCKEAGLPLNISHFKATGIKNWNRTIYEAIEVIEKARDQGQDVTADFYPYCGGSTTLISLLPPELIKSTMEETFRALSTERGHDELKREIYREHDGWDNMVTAIGWKRILISSVTRKENHTVTGLDFQQAAMIRGYQDPADLMADLLYEENGKVGIILLSMCQEDVDTIARLPYTMLISDSLYGVSDCPHPRLYGSFPRFIREYVLERHVISMETAVKKMTSMPAGRLKLAQRGQMVEGNYADIAVFAPGKLKDLAEYDHPKQYGTGISYLFADGCLVLEGDQRKTGYSAKVLKNI